MLRTFKRRKGNCDLLLCVGLCVSLILGTLVNPTTTTEVKNTPASRIEAAHAGVFSPDLWALITRPVEEIIAEIPSAIRIYRECQADRTTCAVKDKARLECLQRLMTVACAGCLRACEHLSERANMLGNTP